MDPSKRADLNEIVNQPWLADVDIKLRDQAVKKTRSEALKLAGTQLLSSLPLSLASQQLPQVEDGTATEKESDSDDDQAAGGGMKTPSGVGTKHSRPSDAEAEKEVRWEWKKGLDANDDDEDAWEPYGAADVKQLEDAHKKGQKTGRIGPAATSTYRVSFQGMFQYHKSDTTKQRPVRRRLI